MLRIAGIWLNWIVALWLIGALSESALSAPWRWTTAQYGFTILCIWGIAVAGFWGWVWLRERRYSGEIKVRPTLSLFWRYNPLLLIGLPACALGVYLIYRFAVGSLQGAVIVAAGGAVWIAASIIWVNVIYPRLISKRD